MSCASGNCARTCRGGVCAATQHVTTAAAFRRPAARPLLEKSSRSIGQRAKTCPAAADRGDQGERQVPRSYRIEQAGFQHPCRPSWNMPSLVILARGAADEDRFPNQLALRDLQSQRRLRSCGDHDRSINAEQYTDSASERRRCRRRSRSSDCFEVENVHVTCL